jgi:hypothetical protein
VCVLFADRTERGASVNELNDIHSCRAFIVICLESHCCANKGSVSYNLQGNRERMNVPFFSFRLPEA